MYAPHSAVCVTAIVIATTGGLVDAASALPDLTTTQLTDPAAGQQSVIPAAIQTPLPIPIQTPLPAPAQTDLHRAPQTPLQRPAQTPPSIPIQTPLQVPAQTNLPTPPTTSLQTPPTTALPTPSQTNLPTPSQTPLPTLTQTPLQAPAQTPLPAPTQTPRWRSSVQTSPTNTAAPLVAIAAATITPPNSPIFSHQPNHQPDHQLAQMEPAEPAADPFNTNDLLIPSTAEPALNAEDLESEVGDIQLLSRPSNQPTVRQPTVREKPNGQLLLRSSAFTSSNVTGNDFTQTGDLVFVNQATFLATPQLGPDTRLVATASGGLTRFAEEGIGNYNSLGFSLGVQQRFTPRTYGQLGWVNDQLYDSNSGNRTLTDNSARLLIGRQDQLDQKLRLDTTYELRARFTNPADRSRITNSLGTRLRYDLSPDWQSTLGYRLAFNDYTQTGRFDTAHQIQAATTYTPTNNTFVSGFASYAFGRSSEATTDLENLSFGIGIGVNLPLF